MPTARCRCCAICISIARREPSSQKLAASLARRDALFFSILRSLAAPAPSSSASSSCSCPTCCRSLCSSIGFLEPRDDVGDRIQDATAVGAAVQAQPHAKQRGTRKLMDIVPDSCNSGHVEHMRAALSIVWERNQLLHQISETLVWRGLHKN